MTTIRPRNDRTRKRALAAAAARLIEVRERLGLTQDEMADRLMTERNNYGRWERQERLPSGAVMALLEQIAVSMQPKPRRTT